MPATASDYALVAIAFALWIQTTAVVVFGLAAWRIVSRMHELLGREAEAVRTKLDETIVEVRAAATALSRLGAEAEQAAVGAQHAVDDLRGVIRSATSAVSVAASAASVPRTLLMAGLSAGARTLFGRWRAARSRRLPGTGR